jgi:valyl-tRNA synthetase
LWVATEGDLSKQDLSCSKEKIRAETKTINKLLNVSRFVMQFEKPKKANLTKLDQLFVDYIEESTEFADKCYSKYDFYHPALRLREFLWETFASHYLEIVKARAYNQEGKFTKEESESAKYTLHFLLERFLILIYPIAPQIASVIAKEKNIDLLSLEFPKAKKGKSELKLIKNIMDFNSEVWKSKKDKGISLREHLEGINLPKDFKLFEKDLIACHNL